VPAGTMPEASRVRIGNSARGDRSRSTLQACLPERRPSIERDSLNVIETGTGVKRYITVAVTIFKLVIRGLDPRIHADDPPRDPFGATNATFPLI
jgi:hypothetical protein